MSITPVTDLVEQAIDELLPERPFGDRPRVRALITAFVEQLQDIEDDRIAMAVQRSIADSVGVQMDQVGKLIGQARAGRNDTDYRVALNARVLANSSEGTPDEILAMVALATGAALVTYVQPPAESATYELEWEIAGPAPGLLLTELLAELLGVASPCGVLFRATQTYTVPGPAFQFDTAGAGLANGVFQTSRIDVL